MAKSEPKPLGGKEETSVKLELPIALYFRDRIRTARAAAQADAEGHMEAAQVIEEIGRFFTPSHRHNGMGHYQEPIRNAIVPAHRQAEFNSLWNIVQSSRNDMVHGGAAARHLTSNVINLITLIEEDIMGHVLPDEENHLAKHLMAPNPICAEPWMPLDKVRLAMLSSSFSTIPIFINNGWHLITDVALARTKLKGKRKAVRAQTVQEALDGGIIELLKSDPVPPDCQASDLLNRTDGEHFPVLVSDGGRNEKNALLGIISAYDLL